MDAGHVPDGDLHPAEYKDQRAQQAYRGQLAHRKTFFSHGSFLPLLTGVLFRLILIIEQIELIEIFNL